VSAVGVAACGKSDEKTTSKAPVAEPSAVAIEKTADVKPAVAPDASGVGGSLPVALETKPRFTLVLGEGKSGFKFRSTMLSDEGKAKIDEMFTSEKIDLNNARFEIEGYTDNLGSKEVNDQVGRARAQAVKQYLGEQYEIPADWISVVSYGMDKPAADNST